VTEAEISQFMYTLLDAWREMIVRAMEREERIAWLETELRRVTNQPEGKP